MLEFHHLLLMYDGLMSLWDLWWKKRCRVLQHPCNTYKSVGLFAAWVNGSPLLKLNQADIIASRSGHAYSS